jgi:hypothetical protein
MNFFDVTQIYPMKKVIFSSMVIFVIQSVSFFVNFFDLDLLCCLWSVWMWNVFVTKILNVCVWYFCHRWQENGLSKQFVSSNLKFTNKTWTWLGLDSLAGDQFGWFKLSSSNISLKRMWAVKQISGKLMTQLVVNLLGRIRNPRRHGNRCDLAKEHCTKCSRNNTVDISGIVYFCW